MTEDFYTHYFDPLLYDIFSTVGRGHGISLPALLEHIHLRLAKETAEVSNLNALLNIGLMDGYRRQINQIRHTLAATFPAVLVSHAPTPTTAAGHATESPTGNAPAEPRFSSPAANEASFPLSRATNGLYADIDWRLERITSQPLHQALRAHFLQRHRATAAPLRLSPRFQALWTEACDLVNRAIADDDVQTYFMQHTSASDYLSRYTTSLYQTWVKDIDDSDAPLSAVAVEESPDFTMLFSPHLRQQDTKYRQSVTETLATLVIYEHLLPDMVRW
ncbi:hypothetical protein JZM24_15855 [Candidatus Sodalis endolongispinus]|uniref:Uncharacterized protein n=1 Tax=Candidatus Sodalis endolongispinus TaxID=2812662 RepID=A0ABS5YE31_9GAMM|nr:hypothetical protein [Candidatus Sodalis endolongispinus]MBT9433222.1 hypothetical protein [Candidatus Sodalis endolongispinus]